MATVRKSPRVSNLQSVQVASADGTITLLSGAGPWTLSADKAREVEVARVSAGGGRFITPASDDNDIETFGHSFTTPYLVNSGEEWPALLADYKGVDFFDFGVAGSQLTADNTSQAGGWVTAANSHVVGRDTVLCWGINDLAANGAGATAVTGWKMALRSVITLHRATTIVGENGSGVTYPSGTWSDFGATNFSIGGNLKNVGAAGGSVQYAVPGGFTGGEIAFHTAHGSNNGALYTFTLDGQAAGTLDTRSASPRQDAKVVPYVYRFTGLAAGAHTLLVTVSSVTSAGWVDGFSRTEGPNAVTLCNIAKSPNYSTIYSGSFNVPTSGQVDTYNAAMRTVVGEFDAVRVADIQTPLLDTTLLQADNLHPTKAGHVAVFQAVANIVGH